MPADSAAIDALKPQARSRVSNGSSLLPGVDGRSTWVRRLRDLIQLHLADLGGEANVSEAKRSLIRRASTLQTELERLEVKFALAGQASADDLDLYQRVSNTMRRHLESLGLERQSRDVTPSVAEYVTHVASHEEAGAT